MSLPAYLANIKSSGIYRFVWDKSEISNTTNEILRLVVGYSERGPFNTPVYIKSPTEFRSVYGGVSKKLERQGCWFHRLALQALRKGPILCLNLKNFKNETVEAISFNPQESILGELGEKVNLAVKSIYNTNRFWTLEPELLEEYKDDVTRIDLTENYITITATDSKETSNTIFIRGYEPTGYDVTFKEWYSSTLNGAEMPSYLEGYENKKLKNYWAEIYVFRGEFTKEIASSDVLAKYFIIDGDTVKLKPYLVNAFGEKKDTLDALAANDASNFIRKYQGILLPEFQSAFGGTISLDILFNDDNQLHKMMMRLNQNALYEGTKTLDDIDTMGWDIAKNITVSGNDITYTAPAEQVEVMSITNNIPVIYTGKYEDGEWNYENLITDTEVDTDGMPADFYAYDLNTIDGTLAAGDDDYTMMIQGVTYGYTTEYNGTPLDNGTIVYLDTVKGTIVEETTEKDFVKVQILTSGADYWKGKVVYVEKNGVDGQSNPTGLTTYLLNDGFMEPVTVPGGSELCTIDIDTDSETVDVDELVKFQEIVDEFNKLGLNVGDNIYIKEAVIDGEDGEEPIESPVCTITKMWVDGNIYITFDKDIAEAIGEDGSLAQGLLVKCIGSVTATSMNLVPTYIKGYEYKGASLSDPAVGNTNVTDPQMRKNNWINYQLEVLDMKGIREGLTNRIDVDYRYLVDTFEGLVVPGEQKAKLALICKLKFNVLGLLNFPAMKMFSKTTIMSFKDSNGFDSKYIPMGGNPMAGTGAKFMLASEDNGASFVSYNTPVILKDPETGVKTNVPAAALVSNDFMDKFTKFLPYSIVAGPNRGLINDPTLVGPDFNFGRYDLDNLEPMGVNCMVYVPGKGTYINSNQTAKQNPVTALSKIHVRELCTFLQDEIERMMEDYHWDFNTPNLRQTLKDRADVICETCYRNNGIYAYYNDCSDQLNNEEVIDNEMIILATSIEPSRGAGKMIQELTLYRTGGLTASIKDAQ